MRNILLLLKNYFLVGVGYFRGKKSRTKTIIGIATVTVLYAVLFTLVLTFMLFMAKSATSVGGEIEGLINSVLAMGFIISVFMALIFALQKVTGGQKSNDTELLLSMPFKKIEIVIAKTLSGFLFNLAFVILFFLPSVIAYIAYTPFNLITLIGCIIVLILIPLIAVGLSAIVDFLVTVCFSSTKLGNIAKTFFTLITLIVVISIYEFFSFNLENPVVMNYIVNWIITFNPLVMIPAIIITLMVFSLGCWLNSLLLKQEGRVTHYKATMLSKKATTPLKSLLKNEANRYFNSPTLMINTLIGPMGIIALTVWLVIDKCKTLLALILAFGFPVEMVFFLIGFAYAALIGLTYPSAVSISLEGKQLWILRSMPISAGTVLTAKALFNILLVLPLTIICSIVLLLALQLSLINFLIMLIIPTLMAIFISFFGVLVNLWFPKLEFENEHLLIKQSTSAVIMLFFGVLFNFALGGLTVLLLLSELAFGLIFALIIIILAILTVLVVALTYTTGQRIFNRL